MAEPHQDARMDFYMTSRWTAQRLQQGLVHKKLWPSFSNLNEFGARYQVVSI